MNIKKINKKILITGVLFSLTLSACKLPGQSLINNNQNNNNTNTDSTNSGDSKTGNSSVVSVGNNDDNKNKATESIIGETSDKYFIGFDYSSYADVFGNSPVIECKVRYDKKLEAVFHYLLPNGDVRFETKVFDLTDKQYEQISVQVDLNEIYNLDPEESDYEDVCDGGDVWLTIYGKDDKVLKNVGGFCPTGKRFNDIRETLFNNLPEGLKESYDEYEKKYYLYNALNSYSDYGVFLDYDGDLNELVDYDVVVIDAQNFTKEEIENYKLYGDHYVFSYINIGSLEEFRPYYSEYEDLTLDDYENWEDEKWIDASNDRWQSFILDELAKEMIDKGVDGFFVDNCDVYYQYPTDEMLDGVSEIMKGLVDTDKFVIMNGGDVFLDAYCDKRGEWSDVIAGINQETVFTKIDWENDRLIVNTEEDREYFTNYLEKYADKGAYIFLLEYTDYEGTKRDIERYCYDHNFLFYITDSIDLDFK